MIKPRLWLRGACVAALFVATLFTSTNAATSERKSFDIAGGAALATLKKFTQQSGVELLYAVEQLARVETKPVHGDHAPIVALQMMLAGTGLVATQTRNSGAIAVVRAEPEGSPPPKAGAARAESLPASRAAQSPAPATDFGDAIQLSPFEVNTTRDVGYVASSTLAGTRFNTLLRDTPAALSIFTSDFLEDIGVTNVQEAYEYGLNAGTSTSDVTGNNQQNSDLSFKVRGLNNASLGRNYFAWSNNSDVYNTERLTFARGPNSVIFGIGGPGGIINTDTKRALFSPRRELQARVGTRDEFRTTLDFNQPLHPTLAMRVNLLWQDRNGWRDHEFEQRRAIALAATWRPFSRTHVRVDAERMRVDQNKPLNWGVFDAVTPWIAAGRPLAQATTQAVPGTAAATSAQLNYYIANSGEVLRLNGTRTTVAPAFPGAIASITNTWLIRDFSLVPREAWVMGPGNNAFSNFDTVGVFLEQELFRDLYLEAAANVQHRTSLWARAHNWSHLLLRADANAFRPDGSRNPYAGQYYIESPIVGDDSINIWNTDYRLTASYKLDFGPWLGGHQVAGLLSRREDENYNTRRQIFNVATPNQPANAVAAANQIIFRTYLSFTGDNPLGLPNHILNPLTADVSAGGVQSGPLRIAANRNLTRIDTALVTTQSTWFDGRLVTTLGLRRDEQEDYGSSVILSPSRVVLGASRNPTPNVSSGNTRTFGAVFHLLPSLSVYYNNANNFTPQGGVAWGIDFQERNLPRGNRRGEGQDMGVKFNLLKGRVVGTLGYYETSEVNSNKAPLTRFNETVTAIYNALRIPFVEIGGNDVTDFDSRGTELELTANLTPHWRLHLNGQRSMSAESNIWPWQTRFLAENLAGFRASASTPVSGNVNGTTVGELADFLESIQSEAKSVAALGQFSHIRYSLNLFTNYTFAEGPLRNFSVGGGAKWRGPQVAGVTPASQLVWGGEYVLFDLSLGYRRKLPWLREPVKFQLNVMNLFDEDKLIPTLSDGTIDYRWQFIAPRAVSLTTTLKF